LFSGAREAPSRSMTAHAWLVRVQFFALGFCMGTWGVHVPSVRSHFGLSDAALAVALLAAACGAVACLMGATSVVERLGLRRVLMASATAMCAALAAVLFMQGYAALLLLMVVYGVGSALFDVSMNTQGSAVESLGGRKVMSGFHGMWSAGGMSGALIASWLHRQGVEPVQQVLWLNLTFMLIMVVSAWATQPLMPLMPTQHAGKNSGGSSSIWPQGLLLTMGLLACVAMVAEGAMYDWSALYVQREVGLSPSRAALAFGVFSAAMAIGRFAGDHVRERVESVNLMRASGVLGAFGMALALLLGGQVATLIGFALVGLALSNVVPVVFTAAAQLDPQRPTHGIATVSIVGYFGFVAGPVLIGFIAEQSSLHAAMGSVVGFCAAFGLGARRGLKPAPPKR
jgi:MFS family permease